MGAWDFIKNDLLGVDDWSSAANHLRKGEFLDAAKSVGQGALELGGTAVGAAGVVAAPFTGGASLAATGGVAARATAAAAAKQGVKQVVKQTAKQGTQAGSKAATKTATKAVGTGATKGTTTTATKTKPGWQTFDPKGGTKPTPDYLQPRPTGSRPNSGWNAYGPDAAKVPAPRAATVTKPGAPSITPPKWDPFGPNTKPWDPYSPKTNPWPDMPKVPATTPKTPTKVPAPTTPTVPKPATPKVPTKVPVPKPVKLPKVGLKPGLLGLLVTGGALAYDHFTNNKPQNEPKPWPINPTNPAPPIAPPVAPPVVRVPPVIGMPKSKQFPDQWNPSSIV